jgi:hypothetical protein
MLAYRENFFLPVAQEPGIAAVLRLYVTVVYVQLISFNNFE